MNDEFFTRVRNDRGLSMGQLGELAGTHRTTIFQIEHRKRVPHPETIRSVANVLGISEGQLYLWLCRSPEFVDTDSKEE